MAYVFSDYAVEFWSQSGGSEIGAWYAAAAVAGLSLVNGLGVLMSKGIQNILTLAKVLGLVAICAAGLWATDGGIAPPLDTPEGSGRGASRFPGW